VRQLWQHAAPPPPSCPRQTILALDRAGIHVGYRHRGTGGTWIARRRNGGGKASDSKNVARRNILPKLDFDGETNHAAVAGLAPSYENAADRKAATRRIINKLHIATLERQISCTSRCFLFGTANADPKADERFGTKIVRKPLCGNERSIPSPQYCPSSCQEG